MYVYSDTTISAVFQPAGACKEGETKCVGTDLYVCQGGQWVLKEKDSPECKKLPIDWAKIIPIALIAIIALIAVSELME